MNSNEEQPAKKNPNSAYPRAGCRVPGRSLSCAGRDMLIERLLVERLEAAVAVLRQREPLLEQSDSLRQNVELPNDLIHGNSVSTGWGERA